MGQGCVGANNSDREAAKEVGETYNQACSKGNEPGVLARDIGGVARVHVKVLKSRRRQLALHDDRNDHTVDGHGFTEDHTDQVFRQDSWHLDARANDAGATDKDAPE